MTQRPPRSVVLLAACAALLPVLGACTPLSGGSTVAVADSPVSTPTGAVDPAVVSGSGVATPSAAAPTPAAVVTQDAVQFVTITVPPTSSTSTPAATPASTCADLGSRLGVRLGTVVTTRTGEATVSWYSRKGRSLQGWRLGAFRQDLRAGAQPAPVWTDVPAPDGCQTVTAIVTGLTSGARYQLLLHAMISTPLDPGPTAELVGRSTTVTVP